MVKFRGRGCGLIGSGGNVEVCKEKSQSQVNREYWQFLKQLGLVCLLVVTTWAMSGCVQADVGVQFSSPQQGEIVQHIRLDDRLSNLNATSTQDWFHTLERRARKLQGRVQKQANQELQVRIPFTTAADLETKFNALFEVSSAPDLEKPQSASPSPTSDLLNVPSQLQVSQSNLLLFQRNHLAYDLDLRSLAILTTQDDTLLQPGSLIQLEFRLDTPLGGRSITPNKTNGVPVRRQGRQLVWSLQPGQLNHIEAAFWMLSPLGLGTVGILLLVAVGLYLQQRSQPKTQPSGQSS
jgi:Protein of unknown function (DUF3153)